MVLEQLLALDSSIVLFLVGVRTPALDLFFRAATLIGSIYFLSLIGLALISKNRKAGINFFMGFAVNLGIMFLLKQAVHRPRPFETLPEITALDDENTSSFPSGHTAGAFYGAAFLSEFYKKFSGVFYFLGLLVFISRIYLGVHYSSDALAGAVIGFFLGKIFAKFDYEKFIRKFFRQKKF